HLAQRIAGKVGTRILVGRPLRGGRPAAEIYALDADAFHRHYLARRIGAEGRYLLALGEKLAEPVVELLGVYPGHGVVLLERTPLLDDLAGRVEPPYSLEP